MANDKIRLFSRIASTVPMATTVEITSVSTSAAGTAYVAFASKPCDALEIVNNSGVDVEYRRNGAGSTIVIKNQASRLITGISNANEISLRRVDLSATPVVVAAEAVTL